MLYLSIKIKSYRLLEKIWQSIYCSSNYICNIKELLQKIHRLFRSEQKVKMLERIWQYWMFIFSHDFNLLPIKSINLSNELMKILSLRVQKNSKDFVRIIISRGIVQRIQAPLHSEQNSDQSILTYLGYRISCISSTLVLFLLNQQNMEAVHGSYLTYEAVRVLWNNILYQHQVRWLDLLLLFFSSSLQYFIHSFSNHYFWNIWYNI